METLHSCIQTYDLVQISYQGYLLIVPKPTSPLTSYYAKRKQAILAVLT